ncbi:hypothetical protein [Microcoleus sp. B3-D7]|uniref:hypothetical protein n=1 Tax=Microcoleus sp. B3-D7 TaxID=2818659 RepID=UPI002FD74BE1
MSYTVTTKMKDSLFLTTFIGFIGFSCFLSISKLVLAGAPACNEYFDGWQYLCQKKGEARQDTIGIVNKSDKTVWFYVKQVLTDSNCNMNLPMQQESKRHELKAGDSKAFNFYDTKKGQCRQILVYNCETANEIGRAIQCPKYLKINP